ncbi:MAG TPA: hypothetical protein VGD10_10350 [Allosphingosinicella sp.]|uniref:hypothetical protein n=1 Tax=Allosphingosinicella sp. TaxID=2823234 RepID=UPI002ED7AEEA
MRNILCAAFLALTSCASAPSATSPQDQFFARLSALCGKAYEGHIVSPAVPADANFAGKRLIMHVRNCSENEIRMPFQVGEDRSRTWVVTRTGSGLRLKHDHRHEDGSEDVLTQYGGETVTAGTAQRQEFPVDQFSKDLFNRQNAAVSTTNVWAMEVDQARTFAYELRRPGRFFRVDFDLTQPVTAPPPAWGTR